MHSLSTTENLTANECKLVAALRDAMVQRGEVKEEAQRLAASLAQVGYKLGVAEDELTRARLELLTSQKECSAAIDYSAKAEEERNVARNEAASAVARADQLKAEVDRLRQVVDGYEIAVTCLHGEEVLEQIRRSQLETPTDLESGAVENPLKFLFRMACKGAHPDHGGTAELFQRVKKCFADLRGDAP